MNPKSIFLLLALFCSGCTQNTATVETPADHGPPLAGTQDETAAADWFNTCLLYTSPSPRD